MMYKSTRGYPEKYSFSDAVLTGIAPDGGLFVPVEFPEFNSQDMDRLSKMNYCQLASEIFSQFADDFTKEELETCVKNAYADGSFPEEPTPLSVLSNTLSILELWHGPTSAFKDMALQILPEFMSVAIKKSKKHNKIAILTATSGDTGKAALAGFKDAENVKIMVFYPAEGVSEMQKTQMITQEGENLSVIAVRGNFDDAQTGVKNIFGDKEFAEILKKRGYTLSSANSINIGRLLPQVVYYYYAYFALVRNGNLKLGDKINFAVPTGNFGNILACYYAAKTGLPVNKIVCATNDNNVVSDFLNTGIYNSKRPFILTISPAMDILISSNLERLLYDVSGENSEKVSGIQQDLKANGVYSVDKELSDTISSYFWSSSSNQTECRKTIQSIHREFNYLVDPHTAVGIDVYDKYVISAGDTTPAVAVSTASPFKFNKTVAESIFGEDSIKGKNEFDILKELSDKTGWDIPVPLRDLDKKPILHKRICNVADMKNEVDNFLQ
ncbi:MAG: threonine synthase [Clostridia bacterium]|nr:threonine synthase [Clostridia bacterium]